MRLCLITRELQGYTPYTGGIGTHFRAVADGMARLGHDVTVITEGGGPPGPAVTPAGARLVRCGGSRVRRLSPVDIVDWPAAAAAAVRRHGPFDLTFAPEWSGWAWQYRPRTFGGPLVTGLATSSLQTRVLEATRRPRGRNGLRSLLQDRFEREQVARSAGLISVSVALLEWSRAVWPIAAIPSVVVPNFIDIAAARAAAADPANAVRRGTDPVIVFTGRLCRWKGVEVLGRAMREVWREHPTARLVLAGRVDVIGTERADLHLRRVAGPFADRLWFLGHATPQAVMGLLAACDVAVFPSLFEAFGMGALEARALGKPVVATSGSGFGDFCRDGVDSLLVTPGSADELAAALRGLLADPERRARYGALAADHATGFSTDAVLPRLVDTFERFRTGAVPVSAASGR